MLVVQIAYNIVWSIVLLLSVPIGYLWFPLALTLLVRVGHCTSLSFDDSVNRIKELQGPTILCVSHEYKCLDGWNMATMLLSCPGTFSLLLEDEVPNRIFVSQFNLHRTRQGVVPLRIHFVRRKGGQHTVKKLVADVAQGYSPILFLRSDKRNKMGVYHVVQQYHEVQQTQIPVLTVRMGPTRAMFSEKPWFMPIGYSMRTVATPYVYDLKMGSDAFNQGLFDQLLN